MKARRLMALTLVAIVASVSIGTLVNRTDVEPHGVRVPSIVSAAGECGVPLDCGNGTTATSSLTVRHEKPATTGGSGLVQIATTETWQIDVTWRPADNDPYCDCDDDVNAQAFLDVSWNSSTGNWNTLCFGCDPANGPIRNVTVCLLQRCSVGHPTVYHAHAYQILVEADLAVPRECSNENSVAHLHHVEYLTENPSNGHLLTMGDCLLGTAVAPVNASYSQHDYGQFECRTTCQYAAGPEVLITYQ